MKKQLVIIYLSSVFLAVFCSSCSNPKGNNLRTSVEILRKGFNDVPDSVRLAVYWYWMSDNISVQGVEEDLISMKKAGITRAFIGNIGGQGVPYGDIKIFSEEWWEVLHAALKKAAELNIEIGIFNSPGWSQSGGPWVKPSESMRYLASADTLINGGKKIQLILPQVHQYPNLWEHHDNVSKTFLRERNIGQDVRTIAYKQPMQGNFLEKTDCYTKTKWRRKDIRTSTR